MRLATLILLAGCGRLGFGQVAGQEPDAPASIPDADLVARECDPQVGPDTVALYTFDAALGADSREQHDGLVVGAATPSASRCGQSSVQLSGGHIRIPDAPEFDLEEGSIELFFQAPASAGATKVLLSRDANGTNFDGHFSMGLESTGQLWVRMQRVVNNGVFRCSGVQPPSQWIHVGVSFGAQGFRLWVDHVEQTGTVIDLFGATQDCSTPHTFGIAGNDNVLVIGGGILQAVDGDPNPVPLSMFDGSIDHLHVRSTWRDFSQF